MCHCGQALRVEDVTSQLPALVPVAMVTLSICTLPLEP